MDFKKSIWAICITLLLCLTGCGEADTDFTVGGSDENVTTQVSDVSTSEEKYLTDSNKFEYGIVEESDRAADGRMKIGFDLDDEDVSSLKDIQDNVRAVDDTDIARDDIENLNYTMKTYDSSWGMGYVFVVTDDGNIYGGTESLKQITGEGVEEWFRALEEKYGLRGRGIVELDLSYLSQVKTIEVVDVFDGKYKEELRVALTQEEIESLMNLDTKVEPYRDKLDSLNKSLYIYRLNMCDDGGNVLATWDILVGDLVVDSEGQQLYVYGDLKMWLDDMEKSHDLDTLVYDRTPGDKYFADLGSVCKGNGRENVNHTDGVEYVAFDLDDEDIKGLKELEKNIQITEQPREKIKDMTDIYYNLTVYSDKGENYYFYISYDGNIYIQTEKSYQVVGEGVEEWFREIEAKYGLDKIN